MNAEFVAVGVLDNRCPAAGQRDRFKGELHVVMPEMLDGLVKVFHFQRKMRTIARWLQERFLSNGERVRADLVLDPESIGDSEKSRGSESQNTFIEGACTRQIRGWIDDKSKFDDLHGHDHLRCEFGIGYKVEDITTGRTTSAIAALNLAGSSTGGSCADSSNQTRRFDGADSESKYAALVSASTT